ncbi:MAG: 2'-5' RNA ligase family protein, partial [Acidimicrobiales bacterium]
PQVPGVRWTDAAQWHVTLAFLGEVPGGRTAALVAALEGALVGAAAPPVASLGPAVAVLGRGVLCVPVAGLDGLATGVRQALGAGAAGEPPFTGHLTLARARGGRRVPPALVGQSVAAAWPVEEVRLVASTLGPGGSRYTTVARATVPS